MENRKIKSNYSIKPYNKLISVFVFSVVIYILAGINNSLFVDIMSVTNYLTWHIIFEFASILVSFSIFTVTYFVHEESKNLKMIILGSAFLLMGILDLFHTLSYKGMADFFIANDTANRATSLWILSRLIGSLGIMISILTPDNIISNIKKNFFLFSTIILSITLFLITTYYPNLFLMMYIEGKGLTGIKILLEYLIIAILSISFLLLLKDYRETNSKSNYQFMIALMLMIFSEFAFTSYGSIYDAFNYIGHLYKVIAYSILYKFIYIENVISPYREMKKTKNKLKEYSENLNRIVQERTEELRIVNKSLLDDIKYAKEMQLSFLPKEMPKEDLIAFDAEYFAAEHLSGDFYNVVRLDKDNIALYIGDVSGHGISAAMLTVFVYQNASQLKEIEGSEPEIIEPGFVLKTIYKSFNKTNIDAEKYVVMLYGIYNIKEKTFNYASAGINAPPYIIKKSGAIYEMNVEGFPICKLGSLVEPFYDNRIVQLEEGDKVLFYSDGLVEAKDRNGQIYGQDKLKNLLKQNLHLNLEELNDKIKDDIFRHIDSNKNLIDDITFLTMSL